MHILIYYPHDITDQITHAVGPFKSEKAALKFAKAYESNISERQYAMHTKFDPDHYEVVKVLRPSP